MVYGADDRPLSISVRIPRDLFARVKAYMEHHQQSLSALVREGLQLRLAQDAPHMQAAPELASDEHPVVPDGVPPVQEGAPPAGAVPSGPGALSALLAAARQSRTTLEHS